MVVVAKIKKYENKDPRFTRGRIKTENLLGADVANRHVYLGASHQPSAKSRGEYMSKKSETVYPEIWGILKLSGLINQKIFETVYRNFQTVSKACALILL